MLLLHYWLFWRLFISLDGVPASGDFIVRRVQFFPIVPRPPGLTVAEDTRALDDLRDPVLLPKRHDMYTMNTVYLL
jgi:hypothetical protein